MKVMYASEFGSTGALAMFWFQRLSAGNGTNPFRLAPMPRAMPLQPLCADAVAPKQRKTTRQERSVRINVTPRGIPKGDKRTIARSQIEDITRRFQRGRSSWSGRTWPFACAAVARALSQRQGRRRRQQQKQRQQQRQEQKQKQKQYQKQRQRRKQKQRQQQAQRQQQRTRVSAPHGLIICR